MHAIGPTDFLLPLCSVLVLIIVLALRVTNLRRRAWNTGDTIALFFTTGLCFAIAFPTVVLIAI